MFPCEYCGIFKNIHLEKHLQTAASHLINIAKIIVKINIWNNEECMRANMDIDKHCVKSVHVWSYSAPNAAKYGPE